MFTRLNTILIPEENAQNSILKLASRIFDGKEELFHIDNKTYYAHITLYSPEYPTHNVDKVFAAVQAMSNATKPLTLDFNDFHTGGGYLGLDFIKDKPIDRLHKMVLEKLNPLREGRIRDKYADEIKEGKYSPDEVKYIKKFGYHYVLNSYHSHLSLGRFSSEEIAVQVKSGLTKDLVPPQIIFSHIAVSEMGPNGTCTKILKKYQLL